MRLLFFILIVLLIAQIGLWNTLGAVLGAIAMLFLLGILAIAVIVVGSVILVAANVR